MVRCHYSKRPMPVPQPVWTIFFHGFIYIRCRVEFGSRGENAITITQNIGISNQVVFHTGRLFETKTNIIMVDNVLFRYFSK